MEWPSDADTLLQFGRWSGVALLMTGVLLGLVVARARAAALARLRDAHPRRWQGVVTGDDAARGSLSLHRWLRSDAFARLGDPLLERAVTTVRRATRFAAATGLAGASLIAWLGWPT